MRTALDTNVISALWSSEPLAQQIEDLMVRARQQGGLVICGVVYVELSAHPVVKGRFLDRFLADTNIAVDFAFDEPVWREVARGCSEYAVRRRKSKGGQPKRLLADFIVGAHAVLRADRLLTLDNDRYIQSFPKLKLHPI